MEHVRLGLLIAVQRHAIVRALYLRAVGLGLHAFVVLGFSVHVVVHAFSAIALFGIHAGLRGIVHRAVAAAGQLAGGAAGVGDGIRVFVSVVAFFTVVGNAVAATFNFTQRAAAVAGPHIAVVTLFVVFGARGFVEPGRVDDAVAAFFKFAGGATAVAGILIAVVTLLVITRAVLPLAIDPHEVPRAVSAARRRAR